MHLSAPFIKRPVATSLLSVALLMAGSVAYSILPVASLPDVDYPVIGVGPVYLARVRRRWRLRWQRRLSGNSGALPA